MSREDICDLIEGGDGLETAMEVNRQLLARYYPGARYAVLVVRMGDGIPDVQLPVVTSSAGRLPRPTLS